MKTCFAVGLALLAGISWHTKVQAAGLEFLFPHQPIAIRLRVELRLENEPPEAVWNAFLDRWYAYFDRDSDGLLSATEAARVLPLPLVDRREVVLDAKQFDANGDGQGSRDEIKAFYRRAGFTPVVAGSVPIHPDDEALRVSEALFQQLDRDANGILSKSELDQAAMLLNRLDENEDEVLTIAELVSLPLRREAAASPKNEATVLDAAEGIAPHGTLMASLGPSSPLPTSVSQAGSEPLIEAVSLPQAHPLRLRLGNNFCAVVIEESSKQKTFKTARGFYLAQFRTTYGNKKSVTRRELADEPALRLIYELFDAVERNADGSLSLEELTDFLGLIEQGVASQSQATLSSQGRSLFEILDTDHDGRLVLRELNRAAQILAGEKLQTGLTRDQIPTQFQLHLERGIPGTTFGPIPIPNRTKRERIAESSTPPAQPRWFKSLDQNEDGTLSPREFPGTPPQFQRFDADSDGLISIQEAVQKL